MARILYIGTAGTDDPTRAGIPLTFALGALEAGHTPELFLVGEAPYLLRPDIAEWVVPVGLPSVREMLDKLVAAGVPIHA